MYAIKNHRTALLRSAGFFRLSVGKGRAVAAGRARAPSANVEGMVHRSATQVGPRLTLINKDEAATGTVSVTAPGYAHAVVFRLTAPSYKSDNGLSPFAGQTFDGSVDGGIRAPGTWKRKLTGVKMASCSRVQMPVTSAALIFFTK